MSERECTGCTAYEIRPGCPVHGLEAMEAKGLIVSDGRTLDREEHAALSAALGGES